MDAFLTADFRRAVRAHLAERPAVAQNAEVIHRHLRREFDCTLEETANALLFCEALGHLRVTMDPMGGPTKFYQATAPGIIAHERGE
jgi:hypothetical protein